jgi:hypothetical protein
MPSRKRSPLAIFLPFALFSLAWLACDWFDDYTLEKETIFQVHLTPVFAAAAIGGGRSDDEGKEHGVEIRIVVPKRFATIARRFKLSPERLAYLLCADFALRPPSCLTIVVRYVRASFCSPRRKGRGSPL